MGVPFLVNTQTANGQFDTSVATLSNGNIVIAWTDQTASFGVDVKAQLFSNGVPLFDDTANVRDLNTLDPANFSGPYDNAGGGDDVVTLPSDGGGILRWGLSGGFRGGTGDDVITAGSSGYLIFGGPEDASGLSDHDTIFGGAGADQIYGGAGIDILYGSKNGDDRSSDTLTGGSGGDIFYAGHDDRILDLTLGEPVIVEKPADFVAYKIDLSIDGNGYHYLVNLYSQALGFSEPTKSVYIDSVDARSLSVAIEGGDIRLVGSAVAILGLEPPPIPGYSEAGVAAAALVVEVIKIIGNANDLGKAIEDFSFRALRLTEPDLFLSKLAKSASILNNANDYREAVVAIMAAGEPGGGGQAREFIAQSVYLAVKATVSQAALGTGVTIGTLVGAYFGGIGSIPGRAVGAIIGAVAGDIAANQISKPAILGSARAIYDAVVGIQQVIYDSVIDRPDADGVYTGTPGDDVCIGTDLSDTFKSSNGINSYTGLGGTRDLVDYSNASGAVSANLASGIGGYGLAPLPATLLGAQATALTTANTVGAEDAYFDIEDLVGSSYNDILTGDAKSNRLAGGNGDDLIDGGAGIDTMVGGAGNDVYIVDDAGDVVTELADGGIDEIRTTVATYQLAAHVEVLTYVGTGAATLRGNAGNNSIVGGGGNDYLDASQGGDDVLNGGAGNDAFYFGAAFNANDSVDGGTGNNDQIGLQGDYSGGLTLGVNSTRNVDVLAVLPGFSYSITTIDANVAAGQELVIYAGNLAVGNNFTFNGSAETNGTFRVYGGSGVDNITTGAGNDGIYFGPGKFAASDFINAGAGTNDQVGLDGNYVVTISGTQLQNVEVLALLRGITGDLGTYDITLADNLIVVGQTFTVFGLAVETGFTLNASAETDGNVRVFGGSGNETITTGAGNDWIFGGGGADVLYGGLGADTFVYDAVIQSTGVNYDRITGFVSGVDKFDFGGLVTGVDASVGTGALSTASFDANLGVAIGAGQLAANHAVLFQADAGDLAGKTFLVVDANGIAGYQAGRDYVIQVDLPVTAPNPLAQSSLGPLLEKRFPSDTISISDDIGPAYIAAYDSGRGSLVTSDFI
ncbi:MAG: hypothetical protein K2W81_00970 [Sphingomonas sp.]|uniref:calcium-binding protein n=1 Tax=Sphingomonas sp. TaxID=28214 RepID=UPI0025F1E4E6|nr:bluetail domain-containing putative surface protein [Sphingomonas sp.]MBY0282514.1 hypothetical protein [Sphingomonas sp.]